MAASNTELKQSLMLFTIMFNNEDIAQNAECRKVAYLHHCRFFAYICESLTATERPVTSNMPTLRPRMLGVHKLDIHYFNKSP